MNSAAPDVRSIFGRAAEIDSPAERAAYLDKACGGDAELRAQVEELLAASDNAGQFMFGPAVSTIHTAAYEQMVAEGPGTVIGPYKLMEQIGEGGFGLVFVAEQHRPVRRKVALKIIKPGMDTRDVIARFEAERQALALMDHPNIAKVFDAGATDTGRPYFVMELVRGIPITEYCDQHHLTPRERLELFVSVCQAIQHAHQKGIIHRDVKPTNVLVTLHDGRPVVKVIDFGVAKALSQQLTERTIYTQFAQMIGTPLYMSPEQAAMSCLDIDTRSDIYSLGVVLYELLTGTTPFDRKRLKEAAADEIRRIIRDEEPARPSTRISQSGDRLATVAALRNTEPGKLSKLVRGELDWIVMKCLEKDRNRRYETANGLARDIERYLNDEAVQACPPSATYRLKKFVRRNKIAAAFVLLLVTAVAALAVSNVQTTRNERRALTETAKVKAVSDLLQGMLGSANPEQAKHAEYTVRQLLDDFSAGLGTELAGQPEVEAEIRATIGRAYWRLGAADQAEPQLTKALELRRRLFGPDHEKVAESQVDYAWCLMEQQRNPEAEASVREALRIYRARGTTELPVIQANVILQRVLITSGKFDKAKTVADETLALARTSGVEYPELATIQHALADTYMGQQHFAEAEQAARQAVEMHGRLHGTRHVETAWGLLTLGNSLTMQRKYAEAEAALREALAIFRQLYSVDHHSLDSTWRSLRQVLEARGDRAGLDALAREELEDAATVTDQAVVDGRLKQAQIYTDLREWKKASDALEEAVALTKSKDGPRRDKILTAYVRLSSVATDRREWNEASGALEQAVALTESSDVSQRDKVIDAYLGLSWSAFLQQEFDIMERAARTATEIAPSHSKAHNILGIAMKCRGKLDEAIRLFRKATELKPDNAAAYRNLVSALVRQGKRAEAVAVGRTTIELKPNDAKSYNILAWLLATATETEARDPGRAVELAQKAVELAPQDGDFWNTLGVAQYRAGDWQATIAGLKKSMELRKGGDSLDWFFLAMADWKLGNKDAARVWYDKALEWMEKNDPANEELIRFRAEAAELLGLPQTATESTLREDSANPRRRQR